jgi:hypothetical protein
LRQIERLEMAPAAAMQHSIESSLVRTRQKAPANNMPEL